MLPRPHRLSRATFPSAREGRRLVSPHFSVSYGPAKVGGASTVVSKKVARRSVDRHLIKRRILAVLRPYASEKHFLVVYARAGSPNLTFKMLKEELTNLLNQTNQRHP